MAHPLIIVPITQAEAKAFVTAHHRHHVPSVGSVFQLAVAQDGDVVGVVMVGRPVARGSDDSWTLEVNRCCTDGTPNACSMLYAAAWRVGKAMGHRRLITYTLQSESGSSLRGAGWQLLGERKGRSWHCETRPRVDTHPLQDKLCWQISA